VTLLPRTRRGALLRFGAATLIVVAFAAATTAVAGLLQVEQVVNDLSLSPSLAHADVKLPPAGAPETLLLIGSDHRAGESYLTAQTDTMMLVRLNAASKTINLLSIPRDLKVTLPNGSTGKLNAAYSVGGGPNGLIRVLKTQVFPGFQVNHIIDINFQGFSDLIDAIGCVDADVDHRYFNVSQPAPSLDNYSSIDIEPGYQRLCGDNQSVSGALPFVRFRHTDTDLVRNARQQDFLRWARQGYSFGDLFANRDKLLRIIGKRGQTDPGLHSTDGLLNLLDLVVNLGGTQIKQIKFPAQLQTCGGIVSFNGIAQQTPCYVTAEHQAEARVYSQFMAPTLASPSSGAPSSSAAHKHPTGASAKVGNAGLVSDPKDGQAQAAALGRSGLPVYYPTLLYNSPIYGPSQYCSDITGNCDNPAEAASAYVGSYPRQYLIHAHGHAYPSYRMTLAISQASGEYYGVQGTEWRTPPILAKPTQTQVIGGRKLLEFFNGSQLTLVAWKTPTAAYWISNTLTDTIPNHQLEAIAASLKPYR
jgi:LCP family protein required for cell wall assembly